MKKTIAATAAMLLASALSVQSQNEAPKVEPAGDKIVSECKLEDILEGSSLMQMQLLESEPSILHDFGCRTIERRAYPSEKPHHLYKSISNKDPNHFHLYLVVGKSVVAELFEDASYLSTASASFIPSTPPARIQKRLSTGVYLRQFSDFARITSLPVIETYFVPRDVLAELDENGNMGPRYTTKVFDDYRIPKAAKTEGTK